MKAVCVCFEVHLPLPLKWYWPQEGYGKASVEKYFDMQKAYDHFLWLQRSMITINEALLNSMNAGARYTFNISGVFLEQCKWAPDIIESFKQLSHEGASLAASPYYHSISPLFKDLGELREQISMHMDSVQRIFGKRPTSFINTELLLEQRSFDICKDLGLEVYISEGSVDIVNGGDPVYVYENKVATLLRHIDLSEDVEKRLSDRMWSGYPLIPDKFASWIASMEGDVITLYIKYDALHVHMQRNADILQFLQELPQSLASHGIEMLLPEEAKSRFVPKELASLHIKKTARYGMHNLLGNHAQHLYMHELESIGDELGGLRKHKGYKELQTIYRYLQQSDIFLEMNAQERRLGYEKAVNNFSILSDIKRSLIGVGK